MNKILYLAVPAVVLLVFSVGFWWGSIWGADKAGETKPEQRPNLNPMWFLWWVVEASLIWETA